jgi:membrane-associated protein
MSLLHIDIQGLLLATGYVGLCSIVFVESGLFFGFFFPGDSLLFTAGLLAATALLNIWILVIVVPIAAIVGSAVGYWFGSWIGPRLFTRQDSFFFDKQHIDRAEHFYEKYGPRAIILARFVPVVRTFVPIVAGVGRMKYSIFFTYNGIGAVLWGAGVTLLGYFLGRTFPAVQNYLTPIIILIVIISFIPLAREWWVQHKKSA